MSVAEIKTFDLDKLVFQSKQKNKRAWNEFSKLETHEQRLKLLAKKAPLAVRMMNVKTGDEFFYAEIGGIIVHTDQSLPKYKYAHDAFEVASTLKKQFNQI